MKKIFLILVLFLGSKYSFGQEYEDLENHRRTADTTIYYVNVNSSFGDSQQIAFHGGKIGVLFQDKFGMTDSIRVHVSSIENSFEKDYPFKKSYGSNQFILESLDLSDLEELRTFQLVMRDDMGKQYSKTLIVNPVRSELIVEANIIKSPITIDCQNPTNTLIEYFSEVKGGKAPFLLEWDFGGMAESTKELVPIEGFSSAVLVDLPPPYFISLKVTDSCGEVSFQKVQVACDLSSQKYNSILFNVDPNRKRSIEK